MKIKLYLGLDVHKDSITLAIAMAGRTGEVRLYGTISNDLQALEKALRKIARAHGGARLQVCYEAGMVRCYDAAVHVARNSESPRK